MKNTKTIKKTSDMPSSEEKRSIALKVSAIFAISAVILLLGRVFIIYAGSYIAGISWALVVGVCALFAVFEKDKNKKALTFDPPERDKSAVYLSLLFIAVILLMIPLSLYGDIIVDAINLKEYSAMEYAEKDGTFSILVNCMILPIIGTVALFCAYIFPHIERANDSKSGALFSALLFALIYLDDLANILPRFLLALVLIYTYKKTSSLFLPTSFCSVYIIGTAVTSYLSLDGSAGGETMGIAGVTSLFFIFAGVAIPFFAFAYHRLTKGKAKIRTSSALTFAALAVASIAIGIAFGL